MDVIKEIKDTAKFKPVLCLFDMDGTCVEYGSGEKAQIMANKKDFFKHVQQKWTGRTGKSAAIYEKE